MVWGAEFDVGEDKMFLEMYEDVCSGIRMCRLKLKNILET